MTIDKKSDPLRKNEKMQFYRKRDWSIAMLRLLLFLRNSLRAAPLIGRVPLQSIPCPKQYPCVKNHSRVPKGYDAAHLC